MSENDKDRLALGAALLFMLIPLSWLFSCVDKDRAATTERIQICAECGERYWSLGDRCLEREQ